ncbi:ubiquitin domain-containing protein 7SL RNA1 [Telopea speciosissima]|uniref:ubiquitin domain-containing protein 7SL RNA1 n=1 Tax=Telopea speciosissima TaxID=54955 RepID=UPI001CC744D9|nr:ubiquitin domain-containing protein 7SL RNA1 [Telopea speciosissima]
MTMRVMIATSEGEFLIEVDHKETILEVKQKIEQLLGVPAAFQTLSVYGLELIDGLDMEDYPIVFEGTKIDLTISPPTESDTMIQITVKTSSKKIHMMVDKTETVRSLKEKIHIIDGIPIKRLMLYFSGIEMGDEYRSLSEYNICDQSEIIGFLKTTNRSTTEPASKRLSVLVQTSSCLLNSASIPLEMKDTTTINELRKILLDGKVLPADDYFFIHKQRIMRDSFNLRWHGVENGDSLYVFKGTVSRGY